MRGGNVSKQDRQGVRTARDLERKYDFSKLAREKNLADPEGMSRLAQTLAQFMAVTNAKFEEIENDGIGNAVMWVYSGVPSLESIPCTKWTTDEIREKHLGDLYIDLDTGNGYIFGKVKETYAWVQNITKDIDIGIANETKLGLVKGGDNVGIREDGTLYTNGLGVEYITNTRIEEICK